MTLSRKATWSNADGLEVGFGNRFSERQATAVYQGGDDVETLVLDFTYLSTSPALSVPAGYVVDTVTLYTGDLWQDGTALEIGDGGDANGWFTTSLLAEATLDNADNQVFVADGAYAVGDNADNRGNPFIYATADTIDVLITGTFTSGTARLVVTGRRVKISGDAAQG